MASLHAIAESLINWVAASSWQIGVLVFLIALAALVSRRMSARFRYALWLLVLVKAFLPPTLHAPWSISAWAARPLSSWATTRLRTAQQINPLSDVTKTPSAASIYQSAPISTSAYNPLAVPAAAPRPAAAESGTTRSIALVPATSVMAVVWIAGVVAFLAWVAVRYARVLRELREAQEVAEGPLRVRLEQLSILMGRTSAPDLSLSTQMTSPFLFGVLHPRIVLPATLESALSAEEMDTVLLHELTHWKRLDLPVAWIQVLVQSVFWFHPFIWYANARLRHERECACDEQALAAGDSEPRTYGESLLKVLLAARGRSAVSPGFLGIFERNTQLQNRLEDIMNNDGNKRRFGLPGALILVLFALLILPMAGAQEPITTGPFVVRIAGGMEKADAEKLLTGLSADGYIVRVWLDPADGKYAVISAAFPSLKEAEELATVLGKTSKAGNVMAILPLPAATKAPNASVQSGTPSLDKLNDAQRFYYDWTDGQFRKFFDSRTFANLKPEERSQLEDKLIDTLRGPQNEDYFLAISGLAALHSTKGIPALLNIATERREKNNRDRWMATRALGIIGDKSVVPELIHLIYYPNPNTRNWAQIALVWLTGQNFGYDWQAWGRWWNEQGGKPAFKSEKIAWATNPEWLDEQKQREADLRFMADYKAKMADAGSGAETSTSSTNATRTQASAPPGLDKLNEAQRFYYDWTDRQFRRYFDSRTFSDLTPEDRAKLEDKLIDTLRGPQNEDFFVAIGTLGALHSTKGIPALLNLATERRDKNNRDRWMAVRALGILGDKSVVPDLIHLIYFPNPNTRNWAQIALVWLTGQNFGYDWQAWGRWWNQQGGKPPFKPEKVAWATNPEWMDEQKQREADEKFMAEYQAKMGGAKSGAETSASAVAPFPRTEITSSTAATPLVIEGRDAALHGVVVDSRDEPLDGVEIETYSPRGSNPLKVFTDAHGKFQVESGRWGYVVTARKRGFAPLFHEFRDEFFKAKQGAPSSASSDLHLALQPGGAVEGTVLAQEGVPLKGAEVWLDRWAKDVDVGNNRYTIWTGDKTRTDGQGRFRIENVPDGALRLHAQGPAYARKTEGEFSVPSGDKREFTLKLQPGLSLAVMARNKETSQPLAGIPVSVDDYGEQKTGDDGRCVFSSLSAGKCHIRCDSLEYQGLSSEVEILPTPATQEVLLLLVPQAGKSR